ncbi:MAG: MFS transporter [Alphaproteobacteria bacterium]|nr:MFS transporter [Alphaproteobacteria bacterium]
MSFERTPTSSGSNRRAAVAWCVFDWANSSFPTVVLTFVIATYVTSAVAPSPEVGTVRWGDMLSASSLIIAVLSPMIGAFSDRTGQRKPLIAISLAIMACATAGLWFVEPAPSSLWLALVLVAIGNIAFEVQCALYNALLPRVASPERLGLVSGLGWGLGYAGGLVCLGLALVVLIQPAVPPFGLDRGSAEHVRAVALLAAGWLVLFALPFFVFVPDAEPVEQASASSLKALWQELRAQPGLLRYLLAYMAFTDGLNTLFAFGGIYAAGSFGMTINDVLLFGIALNATGGLGAAAFALLDDRIGPKRVILIALSALIVLSVALLLVTSATWFWALGLALGACFGPLQAASRSYLARLAPPSQRGRLFGSLALAGRATAFLGPFLVARVTEVTDSQRLGMSIIVGFFCLGLVLMLTTPDARQDNTRRHKKTQDSGG